MLVRAVGGRSQVELTQNPAVSQRVIDDYRVAIIVRGIRYTCEQLAEPELRGERVAGFVIDSHAHVGGGHNVIWAYGCVRIGRGEASAEQGRARVGIRPVEVLNRVGDGVA